MENAKFFDRLFKKHFSYFSTFAAGPILTSFQLPLLPSALQNVFWIWRKRQVCLLSVKKLSPSSFYSVGFHPEFSQMHFPATLLQAFTQVSMENKAHFCLWRCVIKVTLPNWPSGSFFSQKMNFKFTIDPLFFMLRRSFLFCATKWLNVFLYIHVIPKCECSFWWTLRQVLIILVNLSPVALCSGALQIPSIKHDSAFHSGLSLPQEINFKTQ